MEVLYVFTGDYDYHPLEVISSTKGTLISGDTTHNSGYDDYVEGYMAGRGKGNVELQWIELNDAGDLGEAEELLKQFDIYDRFLSQLKDFTGANDYWME